MKSLAKRYFRDYERVEEPGAAGRPKRVLRYVGDRYRRKLSPGARRAQKTLFVLSAALCDGAWLLAVTRNVEGNRSGPLSALGLVLVIPLFFLTLGCVHNLRAGTEMTRHDYWESTLFIRWGSAGAAALALAVAAGQGVQLLKGGMPAEATARWLAFGGYLLAALAAGLVCLWERRTGYVVIPGRQPTVKPDRYYGG